MIIKVHHNKASSFLFDGQFYDTEKPIDVDFSTALRMTRVVSVEAVHDFAPLRPLAVERPEVRELYGGL